MGRPKKRPAQKASCISNKTPNLGSKSISIIVFKREPDFMHWTCSIDLPGLLAWCSVTAILFVFVFCRLSVAWTVQKLGIIVLVAISGELASVCMHHRYACQIGPLHCGTRLSFRTKWVHATFESPRHKVHPTKLYLTLQFMSGDKNTDATTRV